MCNPPVKAPVEKPEIRLARLMEREMAVKVDPIVLRLFLLHHWSKVSAMAHAVHEAE